MSHNKGLYILAPPPKPSRLGVYPVAPSAPDPSPSPESVPVAQNLKNEQIENSEQQGGKVSRKCHV